MRIPLQFFYKSGKKAAKSSESGEKSGESGEKSGENYLIFQHEPPNFVSL